MNREILFKGFHPCENGKDRVFVNSEWIKGEWVEGYYVRIGKHHLILTGLLKRMNSGYPQFQDYLVIPETVGQYTGLTDKNRKKIFEYHMLKFVNDEGDSSFYVVFWNNSLLSWQVQEINAYARGAYDGIDELCECGDMEVIGNIHDNPELLEAAE